MARGKKYKQLARGTVCGVYVVMNFAEKKSYVGSSKAIRDRLLNHKNALRKGCHPSRKLQADYDRIGRGGFLFAALELDCDPFTVHEREAFWMAALKSRDHYNIRPAFKAR